MLLDPNVVYKREADASALQSPFVAAQLSSFPASLSQGREITVPTPPSLFFSVHLHNHFLQRSP